DRLRAPGLDLPFRPARHARGEGVRADQRAHLQRAGVRRGEQGHEGCLVHRPGGRLRGAADHAGLLADQPDLAGVHRPGVRLPRRRAPRPVRGDQAL
ncbi:MAG: hypothetical protein AVDCRST_MAG06-934, partial [uncultured Nocardioides sp.]